MALAPDPLASDLKFLQKCKDLAISEKDRSVPYGEPGLMSAKMWYLGIKTALNSMGYEISKKEKK